ncbi:MAG: polysaccharide export protein [Chitinispirillaceae bacterium]|nr:polysaccharide export protein [Chitinispirillaceae bacterium]
MKVIPSLVLPMLLALSAPLVGASIIKTGDVLDITVLQHPEFSGRYTVNERGFIEYPLLGEEPVINISVTELMNDLTFLLARHIDNPLVLITIIDKPEITVTVLGQVVDPGPVKTFEGASIQEVLKAAGGPTPSRADLARIKIIHHDKSRTPDLFNLDSFLVNGNVDDLPHLQADDIVIVLAEGKSRKVKVIGAIQKPGLFELEEKMNLFEVIYLAGGPTEKADLSRVRRFTRQENDNVTEEVIDLQGYIDKGRMDKIPVVMEGDVIIVYAKWFDWKTLLTVLNNTLLVIVTIQAFAGIFK